MNTPPVIPVPSYANPIDNLRDRSEGTARTLCVVLGIILFIALLCAGGIGIAILVIGFFTWVLSFLAAARLKGGRSPDHPAVLARAAYPRRRSQSQARRQRRQGLRDAG